MSELPLSSQSHKVVLIFKNNVLHWLAGRHCLYRSQSSIKPVQTNLSVMEHLFPLKCTLIPLIQTSSGNLKERFFNFFLHLSFQNLRQRTRFLRSSTTFKWLCSCAPPDQRALSSWIFPFPRRGRSSPSVAVITAHVIRASVILLRGFFVLSAGLRDHTI